MKRARCAVISGGDRALRTTHPSLTVPPPATKIPDPMPPFHRIEDLPPLAGQAVTTRGWGMTTRSAGKIGFGTVRDGRGHLQVVLAQKEGPVWALGAFGRL